jgi:flagellar basal-body rod protein FlgB
MSDKLSFHNTFATLERAIGVTHQRHSLIASNLSNLDTPDYRAKDIDFKSAMKRAMTNDSAASLMRTHPEHIGTGDGPTAGVNIFEEEGEWNGINYVNVDDAMVKLTENSLTYRAATEALLRKISLMKEVIREGGR